MENREIEDIRFTQNENQGVGRGREENRGQGRGRDDGNGQQVTGPQMPGPLVPGQQDRDRDRDRYPDRDRDQDRNQDRDRDRDQDRDQFPDRGPILRPVQAAQVRFLHAAVNFGPVAIQVGTRSFTNNLRYGSITSYNFVNDGFRFVTVFSLRAPFNILFRKQIPFVGGTKVTLAIINSTSGIDVLQISDEECRGRMRNIGCIRVVNLSFNSPPLDIRLSNRRVVFSDVRFKEVTTLRRARPGKYTFYIVPTPRRYPEAPLDAEIIELPIEEDNFTLSRGREMDVIALFQVNIRVGITYTAYIIGNDGYDPTIQVIIVENM